MIASTDYLDGVLARKLGQVSEIGKFLDPLADRLVVFASVVGGLLAGLVPPWLGWPLLAREAVIGLITLYLLSKLKLRVTVRQLGKVATGLVFLAVPLYYLAGTGIAPGFWQWPGAVIGRRRSPAVLDRVLAVPGRHAPFDTPRRRRRIRTALNGPPTDGVS